MFQACKDGGNGIMVNIFLDDWRPCADNFLKATCYSEFCRLVDKYLNEIDTISLDYDLDEFKTGYDAAVYIVEKGITPKKIIIHSSHSRRKKIYDYLKENLPNVELVVYYPL